VIYDGTLAAFADDWAGGIVDAKPSAPKVWTQSEPHSYRITLTVQVTNSAQTENVTQTFTWEARNTTLYSQVVLSDGPVSYWKLDEAAGTTATDTMGAANGTYVNGPLLNQASKVKDANTAVVLDGSNDYVNVGDTYGFTGTASFSFELWMSRTDANSTVYRHLISKQGWDAGESGYDGWNVTLYPTTDPSANRIVFERHDGATNTVAQVTSTTVTQPGVLYHVVGTFSGSRLRIYVNGTLEGSTNTSLPAAATTSPLRIGTNSQTASAVVGGMLDEVAIYDYELNPTTPYHHDNAGRR
jgi:hypothetical protein